MGCGEDSEQNGRLLTETGVQDGPYRREERSDPNLCRSSNTRQTVTNHKSTFGMPTDELQQTTEEDSFALSGLMCVRQPNTAGRDADDGDTGVGNVRP